MIETIKVSSKGQIVIPERIRKHLHLKEGSTLVVMERGSQLVLEEENQFLRDIKTIDKEKVGWLLVAEQSLRKVWDNPQDDQAWSKYL